MTDVGGQQYLGGTIGFDSLIISDSYGEHRRHTTDNGRRTTPAVWHKFPTGELIIYIK